MGTMINMIHRHLKLLVFTALIVAALVALVQILYATNYGPWAYSDAASYIWTAVNIAEGRGIVLQNPEGNYVLLNWHPPLFPIFLAAPIALGAEPLQAARWLNALCFAAVVFMSGFFTWRYTRSWLAGLVVPVLIIFSIDLVYVFSGAMSEALFFLLGFSALILAVEALKPKGNKKLLILTGLLAGLSYLARYAGIVFIGVVILLPFLFVPGSFWKKTKLALWSALPAGVILLAWSLTVYLTDGTFGGRRVVSSEMLRLDFSTYFEKFTGAVGNWVPFLLRGNHILALQWKLLVGGLVILAVLIIGFFGRKQEPTAAERKGHLLWLSALGLFLVAYLGFHVFSYIFSSAAPAVDRRLLSPVLLAAFLLMGAVFSLPRRITVRRVPVFELILFGYALLTVFYFAGKMKDYLYEQHYFGSGYTSKRWQESLLFEKAQALPAEVMLASNHNEMLFFYTGRFPRYLDLAQAAKGKLPVDFGSANLVIFRGRALDQYGDQGDIYLQAIKDFCLVQYEEEEGFICSWNNNNN